MPHPRSTDDTADDRFAPHGRVSLQAVGQVLETEASGPFNVELIKALARLIAAVVPPLAARGPWGQCVVFHRSVMASPDTLAAFAQLLQDTARQGLGPAVTAYVIDPGIEGATLMPRHFARCFAEAGLAFEIFQQAEPARAWLRERLAGT